MIVCSVICKAQEGYRISGKIDCVANGSLLLLTNEGDIPDTLAITKVENGAFVFHGKVERAVAVNIVMTGEEVEIPLILENTQFMINVRKNEMLIKGGEQQDILGYFSRIKTLLVQTCERIQKEYQLAEQVDNKEKMQSLSNLFEETIAITREQEKELLEKYADTYAVAYVVASDMYQLELDTLKVRYDLLGKNARTSVPGRAVATLISMWENVKEGNVAPDFTVASLQGDSLSLHSVKGKLKLLHFWTSNDPVCRRDNVNILNLYQRFHLKGLEIISVSRDENEQAWMKAINTDGMFWKNGLDQEARVFHLYGAKALPYTILLDEENRIIAKNLENKVLQKKINELLKKK